MKNFKKYIISFFVLFFTLALCTAVNAASVSFFPSSGSYKVGDTIEVKVFVDSESKLINAIDTDIFYSKDLLKLESISKDGSILNFWPEEPSFTEDGNSLSFQGVALNGYSGIAGDFITLIFRANSIGVANITFGRAVILAHDGNGTEVKTNSTQVANFEILGKDKEVITSPLGEDQIDYKKSGFILFIYEYFIYIILFIILLILSIIYFIYKKRNNK